MLSVRAADAVIVGLALAAAVRCALLKGLFVRYPRWVWLSLLATADHLRLSIAAGLDLAVAGALAGARLTLGGGRRARRRLRG